MTHEEVPKPPYKNTPHRSFMNFALCTTLNFAGSGTSYFIRSPYVIPCTLIASDPPPLTGPRFLDLASADNARIWWAIREYAIVDSLDERVDLEVRA